MAFAPGTASIGTNHVSTEGQIDTTDVNYHFCSIDSVFNAIQFQILLIDIRDNESYTNDHIRQSFHINRLRSISISSEKQLFIQNDTFLPIYIYDQGNLDESMNENELKEICEILIINRWVDIENGNIITINIMKEGFIEFYKQYPFECTQTILEIPYRYRGSVYPNIVIHNSLYYGNAEQASDGSVIKHLQITHILNITNQDFEINWNDDDAKEQKYDIKYLKLPIYDNEHNKISVYFESANRFINDALNANKKDESDNIVLVHCMFGSSRSGTILVQYMMNRNKISLYSAYKYVYDCRPCLYPNESFMDELENVEMDLFCIEKNATTRKQIEQSDMR